MNTAHFFNDFYNHAEVNSLLIMDCDGTIRDVNQAFTNNFGYHSGEINGKHFSLLFTSRDREKTKPEQELEIVLSKGQSFDENYMIDKNGNAIWCIGESLLVTGEDVEKYIVKDIINMQAKKQLQLFLKETEELLEIIFASSKDIPMMILDGSMKIQRVNQAFLDLFEIEEHPFAGSRIAELNHPFWMNEEVKKELRTIIVTDEPIQNRDFSLNTKNGEQKMITLASKIIDRKSATGRKIFIILEDTTESKF